MVTRQALAWTGALVAVALALFGLDRFALWMESRGWIYWRRKKARPGAVGNALLEVQAMFEPDRRYAIEERRRVKQEEAESGDPPDAADSTHREGESPETSSTAPGS